MPDPAVRRLRWSRDPAVRYEASRWSLRAGEVIREHCHDGYLEVFWVEQGGGEHPVNGEAWRLSAGDCVFVRPDDVHGFRRTGPEPCVWTNLAFPVAHERALRRRYRDELGWWPWRDGRQPHRHRLRPDHVERLMAQAARLPVAHQRTLDLDWFVVGLIRELDPRGVRQRARAPGWLEEALARLVEDEERLAAGAEGLRADCDRCTAHLNRTVRAAYGMTTTELVRHLRLEHAARQLRLTTRSILDIALACGFDNLSYFYRCFRRQYGTTPRHFRLMDQRG